MHICYNIIHIYINYIYYVTIYMYTRARTHIHTYIYIYINIFTYIHMHTCIHTYAYINIFKYFEFGFLRRPVDTNKFEVYWICIAAAGRLQLPLRTRTIVIIDIDIDAIGMVFLHYNDHELFNSSRRDAVRPASIVLGPRPPSKYVTFSRAHMHVYIHKYIDAK